MIGATVRGLAVNVHAEGAVGFQLDCLVIQGDEVLAHAAIRMSHLDVQVELTRFWRTVTAEQLITAAAIEISTAMGMVGIVASDDITGEQMPEQGAVRM